MGLAPRQLWGWTPETVTEYEYDADGRLVRSIQRTESAWDEDQYGLVAASADIESDLHSCGHPLSETTSWEADELNRHRTIIYEAGPPQACQACRVLQRKRKEYEDSGSVTPDQLWSVSKKKA